LAKYPEIFSGAIAMSPSLFFCKRENFWIYKR
jgi:predicted alpha/beta superfamily hydrolase